MSLVDVESATVCDVPPPHRTARETASTYAFAFGAESKQAEKPVLAADWLDRASRLSRMPATRKNLMTLLERQLETLRAVSDDQAVLLGEIIGGARTEGLHTIVGLFRTSSPPRVTWTRAFFHGLLRKWPDALPSVALVADLRNTQLTLAALENSLTDEGREIRATAARAFGILAGRGEVNAFRSLERMALRTEPSSEERTKLVQLLCDRALDALPKLARGRDIQDAVDVAVGMVDVSLKAGRAATLDLALAKIDPEVIPPEIVLAFLTTSKSAATQLPARADLVARFERAIRARGRTDADTLMRFAR